MKNPLLGTLVVFVASGSFVASAGNPLSVESFKKDPVASSNPGASTSAPAPMVVYDNLSTSPTAAHSELNINKPVFGDSLSLSHGGLLAEIGLSMYNSSAGGNTGVITAGVMQVDFYDNSVPYTGGTLANPLLGTASMPLDLSGLTGGGLSPGWYLTAAFNVSPLNIVLPSEVLVTQAFTQTAGTSTRNGIVLFLDAVIGSSPSTVYLKSSATAEGLYVFSNNPGQFGYRIVVVPEPTPLVAAGLLLAFAGICGYRRRTAL